MKIVLNGEAREVPGSPTVADLLESLAIDARLVAVEVDRRVVKRDRYVETRHSDGAEVESVAFVGGGSRATRP